MIRRFTCSACELSIEQFCLFQPIPAKLCGLCSLLGPEMLERYLSRWNARIDQIGTDRGRTA